jgi:penicillin-binding protein 1C
MVFGRWRWQSPGWLGWLGRHAARSWRYLIAKPIRAASFVVVLAAAGGALAWYLTRPTPEYVDYTVVPPGLTEYTKTAAGVRLLSDEASFITLDMLRHNPRPGADPAIPVRTQWPVAWKTGTSWGFRDAWSAGVAGPYVLVVWIGNFGGQGNPAFVGVDAAAPLFFRIVDALSLARPSEGAPLHTPPGVRKVAVCAGSGDLPNADCPYTVDTWYIPGKSPIRVSQLHRRVALDAQMERAVCPPYPPGTRFEIFEFWSSDMLKLFREAGMPRHTPPALPACAVDDPSETPTISSPLRNVSYTLRRSRAETIALDASVAADVRRLFWFDGGALVASRSVADGALAWEPSGAGLHVIRVVDDRGRSAVRDVEVQFAR